MARSLRVGARSWPERLQTPRSRQQDRDADAGSGRAERRDDRVAPEQTDRVVPGVAVRRWGAHRLPVDFQHLVDQVDHPVVGDPCSRVQGALAQPVERERRVGDLDDQHGLGWMGVPVVSRPARHDDDVGLGLRSFVESDRLFLAHIVGAAERFLERGAYQGDGRGVASTLRLPSDEQAVEQLDPVLWAEDADVDQLVVSGPWHPPERKRWCLHGCRHDTVTATRAQRLRPGTWDGRGLPRRGGRPARTGGASSSSIPNTPDNRSSAMRLPAAGRARDIAPAVAELSSSAWFTWRSTKNSSGLASSRMPTP